MGYFDTAQICNNGHVISYFAGHSPEFRRKFCPLCGESTIMQCPSCNSPIPGKYHVEGVIDMRAYNPPPPPFCHECGKAFPWTQRKIQNAIELANEFDELNAEDRLKLSGTLDDLIVETPKTELAITRFKKVAKKLGADSYEAFKSVVTDVVSETIKKSLFGP